MEQELEQLYIKFLNGEASREELQNLLNHFNQYGYDSPLAEHIQAELENVSLPSNDLEQRVDTLLADTDQDFHTWIAPAKVKKIYLWKIAAAAAVLVFGLVGLYIGLYRNHIHTNGQFSGQITSKDIEPGGNRASIRLSDGRSYELKEDEGLIKVGKEGCFYADGTPVVQGLNTTTVTLDIPRGGQYKLRLPDGTMVWLNSETTLEYPSTFGQKDRKVLLKGEAYFEVTHDASRPFLVQSEGQEVKVLGTEFSVRGYPGETMLTTLVQGKVHVTLPNKPPVLLKPGQQLARTDTQAKVGEVQVNSYIGWKDNLFIFHHTPLREALAELSRWYDIEVPFSEFPNMTIYEEIHRNTKLSVALFDMEKATGLQFGIQGRRLTMKN